MKFGDTIIGRMYYKVGTTKSRYFPRDGYEKIPINDQIIVAYGYHGVARGYNKIVFENEIGEEVEFGIDHIPHP